MAQHTRMTITRYRVVTAALKEYELAQLDAMMTALGNGQNVMAQEHALDARIAASAMDVLNHRFPRQASQLEARS